MEETQKKDFWRKILGDELISYLYQNKIEIKEYFDNDKNSSSWDVLFNYEVDGLEERKSVVKNFMDKSDCDFIKFYTPFLIVGYEKLKENTEKLSVCTKEFYIDCLKLLLSKMNAISIRILINEMHSVSQTMNIREKKYEFFSDTYLENKENREEILIKYPVLRQSLWECVSRTVTFLAEMLSLFKQDEQDIFTYILKANGTLKIVGIDNTMSDAHLAGRQVVQLRLETGKRIIYKPHGLERESWFWNFTQTFGENCNLPMSFPKIITGERYGWEEYIEYVECKTIDEIKRYYKRIGINIFVTYLLGTNDIHYENLIAKGEYPVVIDLENLASGCSRKKNENLIFDILQNSVLASGILPYYFRVYENRGEDLSALSGGENSKLSFRIPVVKGSKTDTIHIGYENPRINKTKNRVKLDGNVIPPGEYENEIQEGFRKAYQYAVNKRSKLKKRISEIEKMNCRYLLCDTQKYSMLLSSSYHPTVMKNHLERKLLLYSLWKGRNSKNVMNDEIVESEIGDLLRNDIPFFSFNMNETSLYNFEKKEIKNFFEQPPVIHLYRRLEKLSDKDLRRQQKFIHLSLSALSLEKGERYNKLRDMIENPDTYSRTEKLKMAEKIADRAILETEYDREKKVMGWYQLNVIDNKCGALNIRDCGMYLYNGIAGIDIFFHILSKYSKKRRYRTVLLLLDKQLFAYTELMKTAYQKQQTCLSGIYNGEGSIVYTYLILYWIHRENKYLEYAEIHAEILAKIVVKDTNSGLLDGKSGALLVFCYLYQEMHREEHLKWALEVAENIIDNAIEMQEGIGWKSKGMLNPLLGFAHGNAGVLVAFSKLYGITKDVKYYNVIKKICEYEDGQYVPLIGDWKDFRNETIKEKNNCQKPAAWCHGAGGILLSRLLVFKDGVEGVAMKEDIKRAIKYLEEHKWRDELGLCHGQCGNILIEDLYGKYFGHDKIVAMKKKNVFLNKDYVLTREWYNVGMMDGYIGIGYYLLMKISEIPNYIFLES